MIELSRCYFHIPHDYPIVIDKAESFLQHHSDSYQMQLIDLPLSCLLLPGFLQRCREHLQADGIAVFNLFYRQQRQLPPVLSMLQKHFPFIHLLDIDSSPNLIAVASVKAELHSAAVSSRAHSLADNSGIPVAGYLEQLLPVPSNTRTC